LRGRGLSKKESNLFENKGEELLKGEAPLADRIRPRTLEEFVGQDHLWVRGNSSARPSSQTTFPP